MTDYKSNYTFVWSNYQTDFTTQMNLNAIKNLRHILWNHLDNIISVSKHNTISTFHSNQDLENDVIKGKKFLDLNFSKIFFSNLTTCLNKHKELFVELKKTDYLRLSNSELYTLFVKVTSQWSETISYFRANQEQSSRTLINELKKHFNDEEMSVLLLSLRVDDINQELIDWQKLLQLPFSEQETISHVEKHPWLVAVHFTISDVVETMKQRYQYDQRHLKVKDILQEKNVLKSKQEVVMSKHPELRSLIETMQRLVFSRMSVKYCWAGTDYYIIPLMEEIAKRCGVDINELNLYYLIEEIGDLLIHNHKLSLQEQQDRKKCFVGLWKNGGANYYSGDKAEQIAKEELGSLFETEKVDSFKGMVANKGFTQGTVRVLWSNDILQAREMRKTFQKGNILITQMTQPNIMDIAARAGAIVTEEGGMLSHAAIISRELKIPCIIGTKIATKVLKDGDLVEVDANKGVVRKIKGGEL